MPIYSDIYGPLISRYAVASAVRSHLQLWLPSQLAEQERQDGLAPHTLPTPPDAVNSWKIGIDFETWVAGAEPVVITAVHPDGEPERMPVYNQDFEIQVASIVVGTDEDEAIMFADMYGAAVMAALLQHGSLGTWSNGDPVSVKTRLRNFPDLLFPEGAPLGRRTVQSTVTVDAVVTGILDESQGPLTPPADPYADPGNWPTVKETHTDIIPEPLD